MFDDNINIVTKLFVDDFIFIFEGISLLAILYFHRRNYSIEELRGKSFNRYSYGGSIYKTSSFAMFQRPSYSLPHSKHTSDKSWKKY